MDSKIAMAEQAINYTFADKVLAAEALQMAGVGRLSVQGRDHVVEKNQRLAILGNSLLHSLLCERWMKHRDERGNSLSKGDWATIAQDLLNNENVGTTGQNLGLATAINQNAGGFHVSINMLAETVKALLGAVYLDASTGGLDAFQKAVEYIGLDEHTLLTTFHSTGALEAP